MSKRRKKAQAAEAEAEVNTTAEVAPEAAESEAEVEAEVEAADAELEAEPEPEADPEPEPSVEDILRSERDDFQQKWLRVVAELDNVRKRARREVADTRRYAQTETLRPFLDVMDNFERAQQMLDSEEEADNTAALRDGVDLIYQKFQGVLKERGVKPMEVKGAEFDPKVHEAVGQLAREGVESGIVIEVIQQGFWFGDMVLRPARVIISS